MAEPMTREDIATRQKEIASRMGEIDSEYAGRALPQETGEEFKGLDEERDSLNALDAELEFRAERIKQAAKEPTNREAGAHFNVGPTTRATDIWDVSEKRAMSRSDGEFSRLMKDDSLRAIESMHFPHERAERQTVQTHLERLLEGFSEENGDQQRVSRHILTAGSPTYRRAFAKSISGNANSLTAEEQRAMSLTGASGGFAVPVTLDPTLIPTSNGAVNPCGVHYGQHVAWRERRRGGRFARCGVPGGQRRQPDPRAAGGYGYEGAGVHSVLD
jgi:hypothetical protein